MSFTVTNSLSLRQYYTSNRTLITSSNRNDATKGTLSFADSSALRTAIRQLADYDFERGSDSEITEKLTALADTYNNTLQSSTKYSSLDSSVKSAVGQIKQLCKDHADELSKVGISFDDDGYMKMSDSAAKNLSHTRFAPIFGKESEFMNDLYKYAKKINMHVDVKL